MYATIGSLFLTLSDTLFRSLFGISDHIIFRAIGYMLVMILNLMDVSVLLTPSFLQPKTEYFEQKELKRVKNPGGKRTKWGKGREEFHSRPAEFYLHNYHKVSRRLVGSQSRSKDFPDLDIPNISGFGALDLGDNASSSSSSCSLLLNQGRGSQQIGSIDREVHAEMLSLLRDGMCHLKAQIACGDGLVWTNNISKWAANCREHDLKAYLEPRWANGDMSFRGNK
ncbi:hypothetical protein C8F04DRAFT_1196739 [Mycena alexandri]|uniref:Uncharacterized protein n=1 Tax=Mycena alexandri TaxID=1745969 RepID=A0AAD6S350_9AGAR|nr:hypothetical protein C8F04DRAFT_1196739 [Mycena alexandri]